MISCSRLCPFWKVWFWCLLFVSSSSVVVANFDGFINFLFFFYFWMDYDVEDTLLSLRERRLFVKKEALLCFFAIDQIICFIWQIGQASCMYDSNCYYFVKKQNQLHIEFGISNLITLFGYYFVNFILYITFNSNKIFIFVPSLFIVYIF